LATREGLALRAAWDWPIVAFDIIAAAVAVYYWTLRSTERSPLMRGPKLFEDFKEKQRQALEINDNIVQGLTVAQMALDLEEREESREALERTLVSARKIVTDLLGDVQAHGEPSALVRRTPAHVREPVP
jgi:signal transduction histidine kinase